MSPSYPPLLYIRQKPTYAKKMKNEKDFVLDKIIDQLHQRLGAKSQIRPTRANRAPRISKNIVSYVCKLPAPILLTAKITLRQKMKFVKIFVRDKINRLASSKVRRKVWENATTRYQQSKLYLSLFTQAQHLSQADAIPSHN